MRVSHLLSKGLSSLCCCLRSRRLELLLRAGASRTSLSLVGLRIREYVFPARYLAAEDDSGALKDGFLVDIIVSLSDGTYICFVASGGRFPDKKPGGEGNEKGEGTEIQGGKHGL